MIVQRFHHKGLVRYKCPFVPDEDLCDQRVVLFQSTVLREMLDITTAKQEQIHTVTLTHVEENHCYSIDRAGGWVDLETSHQS